MCSKGRKRGEDSQDDVAGVDFHLRMCVGKCGSRESLWGPDCRSCAIRPSLLAVRFCAASNGPQTIDLVDDRKIRSRGGREGVGIIGDLIFKTAFVDKVYTFLASSQCLRKRAMNRDPP